DLFNPETLKLMGVRVGGGVAAGAAAGAGVDLMVGGVTLGAAALVGALAGGALLTARSYGGRLLGKLKGRRELTVDDAVLRLLALRQGHLLLALGVRGHAAIHSMELTTPQDKTWRKGKIPEPLSRARAHPQWSTLNPHPKPNQGERQEAIGELANVVLQD
ncbi:GTPase SAR1, partial [Pseudomonas avellanae]